MACNGISEGLGSGCLTPTPVPKGGPAPSPSSEGCDGCRCRGIVFADNRIDIVVGNHINNNEL